MHILVAEDDAPLAEFLHQRLEQEQFSVKMVSNGADAEQLASDQPCDLVILDLNLPGDGGLDVLRGIRSKRPRAVVRRGNRPARAILQIGDLELDRVSHNVRRGGHNIDLSPKEFALLEYLMRYEGQPVSRAVIVEEVWKLNHDTMTNVVDVYINYLRRKVDSGYGHTLIRTIRGIGYQIGGNGKHA